MCVTISQLNLTLVDLIFAGDDALSDPLVVVKRSLKVLTLAIINWKLMDNNPTVNLPKNIFLLNPH